MRLLHEEMGDHAKRRANDYLALMYLMMLAGEEPAEAERWLTSLHPRFVEMIEGQNAVTAETARESNPIATALAALFKAYRHAVEADQDASGTHVATSHRSAFIERYQLDFHDEHTITGALARDLFVALKRFAKDFSLTFPMSSVQQFAQRFANDLKTIESAGFTVQVSEAAHRARVYDIGRA